MSTFVCWYCGKARDDSERSEEHIIPSSIGGNRNVTFVQTVCKCCNDFMGRHVDRPFCKSWFIQTNKIMRNVRHRQKDPLVYSGQIKWHRPEQAHAYILHGGAWIIHYKKTDDNIERVAVLCSPNPSDEVKRRITNVLKKNFKGIVCINCDDHFCSDYDR
jgi:hypothetical protein